MLQAGDHAAVTHVNGCRLDPLNVRVCNDCAAQIGSIA